MANNSRDFDYRQAIDLDYLFSAPLIATIDADFLAATRFIEYVRRYGFKQLPHGDDEHSTQGDAHFGRLRMVHFFYRRPITHTEPEYSVDYETVTVDIPLLSILPLPLLQVSDAQFDFDVLILGALAPPLPEKIPRLRDNAKDAAQAETADEVLSPYPYKFRAMLAQGARPAEGVREVSQPQVSANMKVRINMRQADVPAGISALFNIMGDALQGSSHQR
jgi:hypothetical protein